MKGEPRCHIFREWYEMLNPLHERDSKKWLRFFEATLDYVYRLEIPDFSDDSELQELWNRSNVRPYDANDDKPGWVKVWKKRRAHE